MVDKWQNNGKVVLFIEYKKQNKRKAHTCGGKVELRKSARLYLVVVGTVDKDQPHVRHKLLGAAVAFVTM